MDSKALALAERIERAAGVVLEEWEGDDDGKGGMVGFISENRLRAESKETMVSALRSSSAGSRVEASAVRFSVSIDDHFERLAFLKAWQDGNTTEWPEYKPDAILSLHPGSDVQTRFAESESTTHREMRTECSVRALDWQETFVDRGDGSQDPKGFEADSGFGLWYEIEMYFGSDSYGWEVSFDNKRIGDFDDPDQAKACAQADFDKRIKASLSTDASACLSDGFLRSSLNQSNFSAGAEAMREACVKVAEQNKLHWASKCNPCKPDDPSRRIYSAKSAACFQVEMDISALPLPSETQSGETVQTPACEHLWAAQDANGVPYYQACGLPWREIEAREECARRGLDPDDDAADGATVWMVVDQELRQRRALTPHASAVAGDDALRSALELALNIIIELEPGDSRAVSDEFVALAAVRSGDTSPRVMAVINAAQSRYEEVASRCQSDFEAAMSKHRAPALDKAKESGPSVFIQPSPAGLAKEI